jgi:hypothetical protein
MILAETLAIRLARIQKNPVLIGLPPVLAFFLWGGNQGKGRANKKER